MLVFIKLVIFWGGKILIEKILENVCCVICELLVGYFQVEEMLVVEFNLDSGLEEVVIEFYVDFVFYLLVLLIEVDN